MCTITTSFHRLGVRLRSIAPVFLLCYYTESTIFLLSACLEATSDATCVDRSFRPMLIYSLGSCYHHSTPPTTAWNGCRKNINVLPSITRHYHVELPGINVQALAFGEARGSKERFDVQTISTVSCVKSNCYSGANCTTTTIDEHLRTHRRREHSVPPQHPYSPHALRPQNVPPRQPLSSEGCLNCNLHRGQSQEYSNGWCR
ncbi:hypothetical protein DFH29DRAFT_926347 [Suillus ampliporus]|nr:hypothetical protein DFH29DRAFT_926347 [Suillus ampliporus]